LPENVFGSWLFLETAWTAIIKKLFLKAVIRGTGKGRGRLPPRKKPWLFAELAYQCIQHI